MKHKTKGIVLNFVKFRESSIIARIYTEKFGLKSYIINNVRAAKPRYPVSLFQPLTQLEMVVYNKPNASINRVTELKCIYNYRTIPYQIAKSTVALFITEIFYKMLKEEDPNLDLYHFTETSLRIFDGKVMNFMNFHLQFLLKLTRYLGIAPMDAAEIIREIESGNPGFVLTDREQNLINELLDSPYNRKVNTSNEIRRNLLSHIMLFYQIHFDYIKEIKSYRILKEVFE